MGVGVNTYGIKDIQPSKNAQKYIQKLQSSGAPKEQVAATKSFYQTIKAIPSRTDAEDKMKQAIKDGNTQEAVQLAKAYNEKYNQTFDKWRSQYGKYKTDPVMVKSYTSRLITDDSFNTLVNNVKAGR